MRGRKFLITLVYIFNFIPAFAELGSFSTDLVKKRKPITKPVRSYKASIKKESKPREIKEATLWHAPTYQSLVPKRSNMENLKIDKEAMVYLIAGLETNNLDFAQAKKILERKGGFIYKLGQAAMEYAPLDLNSILEERLESKDQAQSFANKYISLIYKNYSIFKLKYQERTKRQENLLRKTNNARDRLVLYCGEQALIQVEALVKEGR